MENWLKNKISPKKYFLMECWQIWDHFTIVILQKYLYKVVSEIDLRGRKCHFWHIQFFQKTLFLMHFRNLRVAWKMDFWPKISISETTLYRYFCHITILKWSQICKNTIRKCFFRDILFVGRFSIEIPIVPLKSGDMTKNGPIPRTKTVSESGECTDHFSTLHVFICQQGEK